MLPCTDRGLDEVFLEILSGGSGKSIVKLLNFAGLALMSGYSLCVGVAEPGGVAVAGGVDFIFLKVLSVLSFVGLGLAFTGGGRWCSLCVGEKVGVEPGGICSVLKSW